MPAAIDPPRKVTVRLTIRPHEPVDVFEDEVPVLRSQGLLVEDKDEAPATGATVRSSGSKAGTGKDI